MRERACNFRLAFLHSVFMCGLNESFLSNVTPSSFSSLLSLIRLLSICMAKSLL